MRFCPKYNRSEDDYDLDHEINATVYKTLEVIKEAKDRAKTAEDEKKILKAIAQTILEAI